MKFITVQYLLDSIVDVIYNKKPFLHSDLRLRFLDKYCHDLRCLIQFFLFSMSDTTYKRFMILVFYFPT